MSKARGGNQFRVRKSDFRKKRVYPKKMKLWKSVAIFGLFLSGCAASTSPQSASQTPAGSGNSGGVNSSVTQALNAQESEFLNLINALRSESGLPALAIDPTLQASATAHSLYMATNSILTHDEPAPNLSSADRIANAGGNFNDTGENIAEGNTDAADTFAQWQGSPGHLALMVSTQYQFIGISQNGIYWTTDFGGR